MGLFSDYFFKTLRLPFVKETGPLSMLVSGAAACLDAVRAIMLSLRDQFCPAHCEEVFLERFARSRGIVRAPLEPDSHWLERVRFAYHWWSRGGRPSAMVEALQIGFAFGAVRVIPMTMVFDFFDETTGARLYDESTEAFLREGHADRWAEFMVVAQLKGNEIRYNRDQIVWAINEVKPARSRLAAVYLLAPLYDEVTVANLFDEDSSAPLSA